MQYRKLCAVVLAALACSPLIQAAHAAPLYSLTKSITLPGPAKWDYMRFDPVQNRLYVSHGIAVDVLNASTGKYLGSIKNVTGSHGIAIVDDRGVGYVDSAAQNAALMFNLKTLKIIKKIPVLIDADPVVYDPASRQIFVIGGDAHAISAIDTATNHVKSTIALGGSPEYAVADGKGSLFVNIESAREIVRIDTATDQITARYAIPACESPHGLAVDAIHRILFSTCENGQMMVVNADSGKLITTLPIGKGTDAARFDPVSERAFSSNKDGTLSVIQETSPTSFAVLGDVPTEPGARTMAVDPKTGRIFLVTATVTATLPPKHPGGPPEMNFAPGTVRVLFYDPPQP